MSHSFNSPKTDNSLRIIVLGYIVRGPIGGMTWCDLHYLLGLAELGHDVYFFEDSDNYPSCYDPSRHVTDTDPTYGLKYMQTVSDAFGFKDRWAYFDEHQTRWFGPIAPDLDELSNTADLLLNLGGINPIRPWFEHIPVRVYVDKDPVFTQISILKDNAARDRALKHTSFFTYGENLDDLFSSIPNSGIHWRATRHPIYLKAWPKADPPKDGNFTTVMQWESYSASEYEGIRYGLKSDSFNDYFDLPRKSKARLEIALGSKNAPREYLREQGWLITNPIAVTEDPWKYQNYIHQSKAEFTVAKHAYVITRSGWFSERSASYLSTGRPVVTQQTGFSDWLPSGSGVFGFENQREALDAIDQILRNYKFHSESAKSIASEYFDASTILDDMLGQALNRTSS